MQGPDLSWVPIDEWAALANWTANTSQHWVASNLRCYAWNCLNRPRRRSHLLYGLPHAELLARATEWVEVSKDVLPCKW